MKKLNITKFASSEPNTFDMYTSYRENYDTFGNCTSVTITAVSNMEITQIRKNGTDISSEWSGVPGSYPSKNYTSNVTETLTFRANNGEEYVETIDIVSIDTNIIIPPEFYASNANLKINSDIKIGSLTLKDVDEKVGALFDLIYPIGSIYQTTNASFNPNASFSGTWAQIKDVFLLAAGDTYAGGTSGGNSTHTHTLSSDGYAKISMHNDGILRYSERSTSSWSANYMISSGGSGSSSSDSSSWGATLGGSTNSGNSMPPYQVVYTWKRTQ